jgi:hypothetical protein
MLKVVFFWDPLITVQALKEYRAIFGNERANYGDSFAKLLQERTPAGSKVIY